MFYIGILLIGSGSSEILELSRVRYLSIMFMLAQAALHANSHVMAIAIDQPIAARGERLIESACQPALLKARLFDVSSLPNNRVSLRERRILNVNRVSVSKACLYLPVYDGNFFKAHRMTELAAEGEFSVLRSIDAIAVRMIYSL